MNEYVDLTSHGDFTRKRIIWLPCEMHHDVPWDGADDDESWIYLDNDTSPWKKMTYEEAEGIVCDRCGVKLSEDLPWRRRYNLCYDCRRILADIYIELDKDLLVPWGREDTGHWSRFQDSGYDRVFLSEFMDRRRARG